MEENYPQITQIAQIRRQEAESRRQEPESRSQERLFIIGHLPFIIWSLKGRG
jgi:hypothetical protein